MFKLLKRLNNWLLGIGNDAMDSLEDNTALAKQNVSQMQEFYEAKKVAISKLEAQVILERNSKDKLEAEVKEIDKTVDTEMRKYKSMEDGIDKDSLKAVIEAYLKKQSKLSSELDVVSKTSAKHNEKLDLYKKQLFELSCQLDEAKFAKTQIEIGDSMNKTKGVIGSNDGFNKAKQKMDELQQKINEQSIASEAYGNLDKTPEELIIENHEKKLKETNLSDEFEKRLSKI